MEQHCISYLKEDLQFTEEQIAEGLEDWEILEREFELGLRPWEEEEIIAEESPL